jgi:Eukaryotic translation initiation factor 3 subunit 8 N-terminus
MPADIWSSAQKEFDQLLLILVKEPQYSVQEVISEEYDEAVERTPESEPEGVVRIRGSVISFIDRLDDEFTRSLQNIDPHGTEYIERLRDEKSLYQSICRAQCYFEKSKQEDPLARVISRRLEHIYSKVGLSVKVHQSMLIIHSLMLWLKLSNKWLTVIKICNRLFRYHQPEVLANSYTASLPFSIRARTLFSGLERCSVTSTIMPSTMTITLPVTCCSCRIYKSPSMLPT